MNLVIDTNRIIASLIRDGLSRNILLDSRFLFYSPEHTFAEISKYDSLICKKAKINSEHFMTLLSIFFEHIHVLAEEDYRDYIDESLDMISDSDDAPFIAAALAIKADGIWTDDSDFNSQNQVKIYTTKDLINLL
jgi:putative PIN family toxin of toxin-antitoxin system